MVTLYRYAAVHDVGVELNPMLVDGQVLGGIAKAGGAGDDGAVRL